jgi:lipid II:glycine glycyltransferase (peptidoglycan interpeptide bridge formation enzyme)
VTVDSAPRDLKLIEAASVPPERWDQFVTQHPRGTAYHLSAWTEVLRRAYRFEPHGLAVVDESEQLAGVLPLVRASRPVSGSRLNSLPVARWGGPLADTEKAEGVLLRAACDLVNSGRAERLHVTSPQAGYERLHPGLSAAHAHPAWWVELPDDLDAFREGFKSRSRSLPRNVRRAEREGVTVREAHSRDDLRAFYRLYLIAMRGRRVLPRSFRQLAVAQHLLGPSGVFKLFVAELDGRIVAGAVFHVFRDTVDLLYNASDDRYLHARPNHALYWEVIRLAIESGAAIFDFGAGRSGSSLAEFKRRWGAEPVERWHYTYPARRTEDAARRVQRVRRVRRGDSRRAAAIWKRAPLALTRLAGTVAYRYL